MMFVNQMAAPVAEQHRRRLGRIVLEDRRDQFDHRGDVVDAHDDDEGQHHPSKRIRTPVDAAWIADHQHDEQAGPRRAGAETSG